MTPGANRSKWRWLFIALSLSLSGCVPVSSKRLNIGTDGLDPDAIRGALVEIATKNGLAPDFYPDSISASDPFRVHDGWGPGWIASFGYPKNTKVSTHAQVHRDERRAVLILVEYEKSFSPEVLNLAANLRADVVSRFGAGNVIEEK